MGAQYLYTSIFLAAFGAFVSATVMGWSSPMLERLKKLDDNPLGRVITRGENSWLASLSILGSCIGCIVVGMFTSKLGRKTLLVLNGIIVFTFFLVMVWAESVWLLYVCRLMTGFGVGGIFSVLPMYFGEMAEAKNRGMISTSMVVFLNGGMLFSFAAGPYFTYFSFHITLAALAGIFTLMFFIFAPESPYYLIRTDRSKAKSVLKKLRGEEKLDETLDKMEESLRNHSEVSFMEVFKSRASVKTLIIGIGGFTFTQFTGSSIFMSYSETILKEAGGAIPPEEGPIIINVIQFVTSLVVTIFADKFPRKYLLAVSHAGIALSQIPLGTYFHLKFNDYDLSSVSWLPLICMIAFSVLFSVGVGPVLMTFMGEIFPPKIKSVVVSWLIAYNLGSSFLITLLYNSLEDAIGIDYLLWISAVFGFAAVIFVWLCMIETKGKTLQEIQDELNARYN
ncbi:facilitated trehalose transporter Tret1-like [Coccinella septempunctata]|uniref:facilitated trehalose transporter Tret1-like n=1 Tax=Coccinella septempunctata TaxID=41139 RepID=UPI001D0966FF|nr:facilitated trehalose transporter Tret1-like [Coccinella septempunctata]